MEIDIDVRGSVEGVETPEEDFDEEEEEDSSEEENGLLVRIGFLLKDKLKVFGEGENAGQVIMRQCCYEQKIISMRLSDIEDMDNLKQEVHRMLRDDMHMDTRSARMAFPDVATTISDTLHPMCETITGSSTMLLEVRIDCSIRKRGGGPGAGEPSGEHGYARLQERLDDDDDDDDEECSICHEKFSSSKDIIVTTCHHMFHSSCILQWLRGTRQSCPICRFDLAPMVGGSLPLRT